MRQSKGPIFARTSKLRHLRDALCIDRPPNWSVSRVFWPSQRWMQFVTSGQAKNPYVIYSVVGHTSRPFERSWVSFLTSVAGN